MRNLGVTPAVEGGSGEAYLQASFFELNTATGLTQPFTVEFQTPEPGSP
ncbi:MAG TPA: hypothetical protein VGG72_23965 [Bryobacteraceae bacterium]|jgi:hypothetical protein